MSVVLRLSDDVNIDRLVVAYESGGAADFLDNVDPNDVESVEFLDEDE